MPAFKLRHIKNSARKLQEKWLLAALAYEDPDEMPDEVLHICQMYAHAMEIKDPQDAFEKIKRAKKEWRTLNTLIEADKIKQKQKYEQNAAAQSKAPDSAKKPRKKVRSVGAGDRAPRAQSKTATPRRGNSRKK